MTGWGDDLDFSTVASVRTAKGRGFGSYSELGMLCENELLTSNATQRVSP